jgi:hypothetical protein
MNYSNHPQVKPELSPWSGYLHLHIIKKTPEGFKVGTEIVFKDVDSHEMMPPCPIQLSRIEAQELIDALWASGLRPTEGKGTAGLTEAMKAHIDDLRHIAFKHINK